MRINTNQVYGIVKHNNKVYLLFKEDENGNQEIICDDKAIIPNENIIKICIPIDIKKNITNKIISSPQLFLPGFLNIYHNSSSTSIDPKEIDSYIFHCFENVGTQQDPTEAFRILGNHYKPLFNIFKLTIIKNNYCVLDDKKLSFYSTTEEIESIIKINKDILKKYTSLNDLFRKKYTEIRELEACKSGNLLVTTSYETSSNYLVFNPITYEYPNGIKETFINSNSNKKTNYFRFNNTINLNRINFEKIGYIIHLGKSVNSGHYIAIIKKNRTWYQANDSRIEEIDINTIDKTYFPSLVFYKRENYYNNNVRDVPIGLHNRLNTCYFNSLLQNLANISPLNDYYLNKKFLIIN